MVANTQWWVFATVENTQWVFATVGRSKCGKPNDELPVEGSRKDTVLQCECVDECNAMDMKQTSNCSGFNVTFRPSAFFRRGTLLIYR